ncbi:MAG: AEC family transporter [Clostridia bacterium]|nr:AEC family transporter [Clostridia bacterium]
MNSFYISLSAVLPMFVMLALGFFLRRTGVVDEKSLGVINRLCFKVFLAVNVYYNIYKVNIAEVLDWKLLITAVLSQFVILGLSVLSSSAVEKDRKRMGALAHGMFHTNFVIFGTLIGTALCGEDNIGGIVLLIAVIVPLQNVLSVFLLEYCRQSNGISIGTTVMNALKNPYVIAAVLGFLTQLLHIHYPEMIANIFRDLGRCGTPLALIAMGGLFNLASVSENTRDITAGCLVRLVIIPALLIPLTVWLGFRGSELVALMCIFFAPCATSSFNLACAMDSDADLTSQLIVFTSLFSLVTIFVWIFTVSSFGLL